MTRLIIHIGAKKTGTTSVQTALKGARDKLSSEGIYLSTSAGKFEDRAFPRHYIGKKGYAEEVALWYQGAVDFMKNDGGHTAIISSESLADLGPKAIGAFRADIPDVFDDFLVVLFIRRQDLSAVSHYSTELKGGSVSKALISRGFGSSEARGLKYWTICRDWGEAFGRNAVRPHLYPDQEDGFRDVVEEFLSAIGFPEFHGSVRPSRKNPSLSRNIAAYLRRFNELAKKGAFSDNRATRNQYIRSLENIADGERIPYPPKDEAVAFFQNYADENRKLKQEYFPQRRHLFSSDFSMYPDHCANLDDFVDEEVFQESVKPFLAPAGLDASPGPAKS